MELLPTGDEISRLVWVMKKRELVWENQKFCERKQFAQGHVTSQCQSKELNTLKKMNVSVSSLFIRAPSSWCQEFSPGGRKELQWPSWNNTSCLREKRLWVFQLRNLGSKGRSEPTFHIIHKMLSKSLSNLEQD